MTIDIWFAAPIGALLICLLRVTDVSMAMMRMILAVRGHRVLAAAIGFVEVLIWLVAIGKALEHLNSPLHVAGYAMGFATGNYVGVWLEERFALGVNVVHAVIRRLDEGAMRDTRAVTAATRLRDVGHAVTELEGQGLHSSVDILNIVVARRNASGVVKIIREEDPEAFISIEEVRSVQGGHIRPGGRKLPFLLDMDVRRRLPKRPAAVTSTSILQAEKVEAVRTPQGAPAEC